jgi:hypothetical protein
MFSADDPESTVNPQTRQVRLVGSASYPASVDRWAVVIGISQYKHPAWNLKYANRDPDELMTQPGRT